MSRRSTVLLLLACLATPRAARGMLDTAGFRAVPVAHHPYPISALAVAPDGRLFATVQALGQTTGTTPGTAEIRVYSAYRTNDGSVLDEGAVWAAVPNVRATTSEEGLLGIAVAPDFATSKLVYVYLTTTDEQVNQQIWVYRENAAGTGDFIGVAKGSLEPPAESTTRDGGALVFGVDGCLYVGVGDNGSSGRWNAQLLVGTDPIQSSENTALCANVCLGPEEYPARTVTNDGQPNQAGKVLRLAVNGASPAQPGPGAPLAAGPDVYGAGMRNPGSAAVHPLTGQLWVADRPDTQSGEIDVVDLGSNGGWPCLEGDLVTAAGLAACLGGLTPADVYANHPTWRRPVVTHDVSPPPVPIGLAVYTGLGYPAGFFGDVFYLLRGSDRVYRVDLDPPCFLPHPNGVTPLAFHDSANDDDFTAFYDPSGGTNPQTVSFPVLTAMVQAPNPLGQQVLYVAGKEGNSSSLDEDSVIFRIEYATDFTPYAGAAGRVPDSCFTDGVYSGGGPGGVAPYGWENPFLRATCSLPGSPCPGQPDGTPCDDGDPCNGTETCMAGVCQHGAPAAEGTACGDRDDCHAAPACHAGRCVVGPALPDGTACAAADPCVPGVCAAGACTPAGSPTPLTVSQLKLGRELHGPGSGTLSLTGWFQTAIPVAPESTEPLTLELRHGPDLMMSAALGHPASDRFWKHRNGMIRYANRRDQLSSVVLRVQPHGTVQVDIRGHRLAFAGLDASAVSPRLVIGRQCFVADLTGACRLDAKKLRCRR